MDKGKVALAVAGIAITGVEIWRLISGLEPQKYSSKWFEKTSDAVLKEEREVIRKKYCNAGTDCDLAGKMQNLLWRIDKELSKRAWDGEVPTRPSYHREHGYGLYKPD